jgi:transcriptional regulator with XRE-family HTH domain
VKNTPAQRHQHALTALSRITDPAERAKEGHRLQEAIQASAQWLRGTVDRSVAELRDQQRMPLHEIAQMLGVTVQRISQMANSKHGTARPGPTLIYAVRVHDTNPPGSWQGEPNALTSGYGTAIIGFYPNSGNPEFVGHELEIRFGQVPDDRLPSFLQGYTTVNGVRMRPTAVVQDLLFDTSLAANRR